MEQPLIKDVIVVTASESSTHTIDTEGEQDSHVTANCIGSGPVQPADQLKSKERETMVYQQDIHSGAFVKRWHGNIVVMIMSNCSGVHSMSHAGQWGSRVIDIGHYG